MCINLNKTIKVYYFFYFGTRIYYFYFHKTLISFFITHYFLFSIINAAMTPGTQPAKVNKVTIIIDPQPLSIIARGGKIIAKITRKHPMI